MPIGMQMQKPLNLLAYAAIYPDHQVIKEKLSFLTLHKLRFFVKNCGKTMATSIRTHPLVWIMFANSEQYSGKLEICATHSAHRSESLTRNRAKIRLASFAKTQPRLAHRFTTAAGKRRQIRMGRRAGRSRPHNYNGKLLSDPGQSAIQIQWCPRRDSNSHAVTSGGF